MRTSTRFLLPLLLTTACSPSGTADSDTELATTDGSDTESDSDTDSTGSDDPDTGAPGTMPIVEDVWNEARGCWEQRTLHRPEEYWGEVWSQDFQGDGCYSATAGRLDCYDDSTESFDFSDCQPLYAVYSSGDRQCSRYIDPSAAASTCDIADPWVADCALVDGCCDLDRAHATNICVGR